MYDPEVVDLMHCYKLHDMFILRQVKNKNRLKPILELDFGPLSGPGFRTGSRFSYRYKAWNQQNKFRVKKGLRTRTITLKRVQVQVQYDFDPEPFHLQPYVYIISTCYKIYELQLNSSLLCII